MLWLFLLILLLFLVVGYIFVLINRIIDLFNKEFFPLKQKVQQIKLEQALEKDLNRKNLKN